MDFELNETERMLNDSLIRFRENAEGMDEAAQWAHCCDMAWQCASVPEDAGGFGMGLIGAMLVAEQLGAALSSLNWQDAAVLPAMALVALAQSGQTTPLEGFLSGETRFGLVASTAAADIVLRQSNGDEIRLDDAQLTASPALRRDLATAAQVTAAATHLGAMQQLFDMTLDYTKTRHQFGRALSSFQALQHRMVDMSVALEEARSLVMAATMAASEGRADASRLAAAAWQKAQRSGQLIAEEAIQLHGGIGMTEECKVGAYVKLMFRTVPMFRFRTH